MEYCEKGNSVKLHSPGKDGFQGIESIELPNGPEQHGYGHNHQEDETYED